MTYKGGSKKEHLGGRGVAGNGHLIQMALQRGRERVRQAPFWSLEASGQRLLRVTRLQAEFFRFFNVVFAPIPKHGARPRLATCSHRPHGSQRNNTAHLQSAAHHNLNGKAYSTSHSHNAPPAARRRNIGRSSVPSASSSFHTPAARHESFLHSQPTAPQKQLLAGISGGCLDPLPAGMLACIIRAYERL